MFKVRDNKTGKIFTVYDITYDANDDPYFLVYDDGIWVLVFGFSTTRIFMSL